MHKKQKDNKHIFALYWSELSQQGTKSFSYGALIEISDDLAHRMQRVLRLEAGDMCILFDRKVHALASIKSYSKKSVLVHIDTIENNIEYKPFIRFLLPLLKREHLDEALYSLTEMGVNQIDLVITKKSRNETIDERIKERMMRIIIAAAEQSKHYAYPLLQGPYTLSDIISSVDQRGGSLFFDPQGQKIQECLSHVSNSSSPIIALIGPEGDLTEDEKLILRQKNFLFCRLTPTILRAHQAAALAAGILRSCY